MGSSDEYILLTEYGFQIKDGDKVLFDSNWSLEEMLSGGPREMTNEEIRNEINGATKKLRETTRMVNEALNHAAGRLDKAEKEAYDRGLNDCWEMVWNVFEYVPAIRAEIFGVSPANFGQILTNFTPQQALAKIRAWEEKKAEEERKKQEEDEKIQIGDVVEFLSCDTWERGVVVGFEDDRNYIVKIKNNNVPQVIPPALFSVIKTSEHVDILGVLEDK